MDQTKINNIKQQIDAISEGELNIKVYLYEQLLSYTIGCFGFYDNAMEFLKEQAGPPEATARFAPSSAAFGGGSSLAPGFAPHLMSSIPSMGGYALGAGPGTKGYRPLVKPLNLSGMKKGPRKTRRRRRQNQ